MDIAIGDVLELKKPHPCGANKFCVFRVGADLKLRCERCGREVMVPRRKIEKSIKRILRASAPDADENSVGKDGPKRPAKNDV